MRSTLITLATRAASVAGGRLVSNNAFSTITHQRLALLKEAADLYREKLDDAGCTGLVFSFNRPVQLHATLASYFDHAKNPVPLIIQYRATDARNATVYDELKRIFKTQDVSWVEETSCRETLLDILGKLRTPKLFFFLDDDIFINPVDMAQFTAIDPLETIPVLRYHPRMTRCYTAKRDVAAPATLAPSKAHKGMMVWQWGDAPLEWDYPYAVEGHLFDTAEIVMMTRASPFKAPNSYEGVLHGFAAHARTRKGLCYDKQIMFNNPCNKVQTENDNHAGVSVSMTPAFLLEQWEAGMRIDWESLAGLETNGPHFEVAFGFVYRN